MQRCQYISESSFHRYTCKTAQVRQAFKLGLNINRTRPLEKRPQESCTDLKIFHFSQDSSHSLFVSAIPMACETFNPQQMLQTSILSVHHSYHIPFYILQRICHSRAKDWPLKSVFICCSVQYHIPSDMLQRICPSRAKDWPLESVFICCSVWVHLDSMLVNILHSGIACTNRCIIILV